MRSCPLLIALGVLLSSIPSTGGSDSALPRIVPEPRTLRATGGTIALPARVGIVVEAGNSEPTRRVARVLAADLGEVGFRPTIAGSRDSGAPRIALSLKPNPRLGPEGYTICIGKDIRITAPHERGLFWGTRSLLQILAGGPGVPVPGLDIEDSPRYGYRALMVDVARHSHSIDFHRSMVKRLAYYKINTYHIHLTDNESYTLPSDAFPGLPTPERHYTKAHLKDLVRLAADYHVTIVPEIDIPGHARSLCAGVPDLLCNGRTQSGVICVGSQKSYSAMTALISEVMDIFPGPYFHIGADEVPYGAWSDCPDCAAMIEKERLDGHTGLYNRFINQINRFVRSKGRRTIVWEGFRLATVPTVDKDVLVEVYENEYALPGELVKAGYDILNASWSPLYVVGNRATPADQIAEWDPTYFGKGTPPVPLENMARIEPTDRLKGASLCSWENEEGMENALLLGSDTGPSARRLQAFAERVWRGGTPHTR